MGRARSRYWVLARVVALTVGSAGWAHANSVSTWIGPISGLWFSEGNWIGAAGAPTLAGEDSLFPATGGPAYEVTIPASVALATTGGITLADPNVTLVTRAQDWWLYGSTVGVQAGTFQLANGMMENAVITVSPSGAFVVPAGTSTPSPAMRDVTFNGEMRLDRALTVVDRLELGNSTVTLMPPASGSISGGGMAFLGTAGAVLTGTGLITTPASDPPYTSYTLHAGTDTTIGPGITIKPGASAAFTITGGSQLATAHRIYNYGTIDGTGVNSGVATLVVESTTNYGTIQVSNGTPLSIRNVDNRGTITVTNGGLLDFSGDWSSSGAINVTNSYGVVMNGNFTSASAASINTSNTAAFIYGTMDNTGATVALDRFYGEWPLKFQGNTTGTVKGGTVTANAPGGLVIPGLLNARIIVNGTTGDKGVFDGVTLATPLSISGGASLTVANGITLAGGKTITMAGQSHRYPWEPDLPAKMIFTGDGTVAGNGTIAFGVATDPVWNTLSPTAGGTLTIGPGVTVKTAGGSGTIGDAGTVLVNQGTISAQDPGRSIVIAPPSWTNQGTVEATNSGTLTIGGTVQSSPTAVYRGASGGVVIVYGNVVGGGTFDSTTGTVTLAPSPSTGTPTSAGTITGGTVNSIGGGGLHVAASASAPGAVGGVIDGVTVAGAVTVENQANLVIRNGVTFQGGGIALNNTSSAAAGPAVTRVTLQSPSATLAGTGEMTFTGTAPAGVSTSVLAADTGALTVGPGFTIRTAGTDGSVGTAGTDLVNHGTFSAQTFGRTLSIAASNVTNDGVIETAGGTMAVSGNWTNAGTMRALNGGSLLTVSGSGTNSGTISSSLSGSVSVSGTWTNAGTIAVNGGTLNLGGTWSNPGSIVLDAGVLNLGGSFTSADVTRVQRTGGTMNITGTMDNAGATFDVGVATGSVTVASGGTIHGGTITRSGTSTLTMGGNSTLDGVTLDADLSTSATTATITGGITLGAGRVLSISPFNSFASASLQFNGGDQTLGGTGRVEFTGGSSNGSLAVSGDSTLTIGPGVTVQTGTRGGTVTATAGSAWTNQGTIWAGTAGQTLTLSGNWSNTGTLKLTDGTMELGGSFTGASLTGLVKTGGTLVIDGTVDNAGNTMTLPSGTQLAAGAAVTGGTIAGPAGSTLSVVGNTTLDGVTLATDVAVEPGGTTLTVQGLGAMSGNTIAVRSSTLALAGGQTVSGTGRILFDGSSATDRLVVPSGGGGVTLGPGITVEAGPTAGAATISGSLVNQGTIRAGAMHPVTIGSGAAGEQFQNQGTIEAQASGRVQFAAASATNTGTVSALAGSQLWESAADFTNAGTMTASDADVAFMGSWTNTGTIAVNGGTLTLGGTSTATGSITATGAAVTLAGPVPTGATFTDSAVTLGSPYTTAQVASVNIAGAGASIAVGSGGTLDNTGAVLTLSASAVPWRLTGGTISGGTITSTDATPLVSAGGASTLASLVLDAAVTVASGASLTLSDVTNHAVVNVDAGGMLTAGGTPAGNISVAPGGTLAMVGPVGNLTGVTMTGATLALKAAATTAELRSLAATGTDFSIAAGGVLNNTGDDLHPSQPSNTWSLSGGTVVGGVLGSNVTAVSGTSTIIGVALGSDLVIGGGATVSAASTLTLAGGHVRFTGSGGTLALANSVPLTGNGEVVFDGTSGTFRQASGTLSVPAGVTVRTGGGSGTIGTPFQPVNLDGLVSAQTPGQSLTVTGNWQNLGTMEAVNGSTLILAGNFSNSGLGNLSTSGGGTVVIGGNFSNYSSTLTLSQGLNVALGSGGTIIGGSITTPDDTPLVVSGTGANLGADVDARLVIQDGAGVTFTSSGFVATRRSVTGSGATLTVAGPWQNMGTATLSGGSTLNLTTFGTISGPAGSVQLTDSMLNVFRPISTSALAAFQRTNTPVNFSAMTLTNAGATLSLSDAAGGGRLAGSATISGGTVATSGTARLAVSGSSNSLSGVILAGGVTIEPGGSLTVGNTLTGTTGAQVSVQGGASPASLLFQGSQTVSGTIDVSFDGTSSSGVVAPTLSGTSLTLGSGVTVRTGTQGGTLGASGFPLSNAGKISARTAGMSLNVVASSLINTGQIEVTNGGTLKVTGSFRNITGGTVVVGTGSAIVMNSVQSLGNVDLAGGIIAFDYRTSPPVTLFRNALAAGRTAAGTWTGTGLASSVAAADPDLVTAIGYIDAATYFGIAPSETATWDGLTVDGSSLLLKLTYYGDADFDGRIDADDYALLDRSFDRQLTSGARWVDGDFDYDGSVTVADYLLIDRAFIHQSGGNISPSFLAQRETQFGSGYISALLAPVPEPCAVISVGLCLPLLRRRRANR